jgi:hypothetical protein
MRGAIIMLTVVIGFFLMKKAGLLQVKIKVRLQIVKKLARVKRL